MSEHQEHTHHITPISTFVKTFIALMVLLLATIGSSYIQFENPFWNNFFNLGISVCKATLVVMFFMGLKYSTSLTKIFGLAGFIWLLLMGITFGDYATRKWESTPGWYATDRGNEPQLESQARNLYGAAKSVKVEVGGSGQPPELQHELRP